MNAIMDVIKHRWNQSVFYPTIKLNNQRIFLSYTETVAKWFWRFTHEQSWRNAYVDGWKLFPKAPDTEKRKKVLSFFIDAWHLAKSLMLLSLFICIALAMVAAAYYRSHNWMVYLSVAIIARAFFGLAFNLFYTQLLIRKQ